jgi:NitT/TauT family transport system substrate-binding protein
MLAEEGFSAADRQTVSVPSLGDRMALLGSGEIQAAMLPEPLTSLALQQGAVVVLDDSKYPEYSHSTITFRKEVLDQNPEAVRAFLAAVEEAVALINADPAKYEKTLVELNIVPAPLEGKFAVPQFVTAGVPSETQFQDVLEWARSKGLVNKDYSYADLITAEFLP